MSMEIRRIHCWNRYNNSHCDLGHVLSTEEPRVFEENSIRSERFDRLQPTAPLLVPRETLRKCSIGGYQVPAKTLVHVNAWAIGRDPETWEKSEEFRPERFIGSPIDYKGRNFELIPFGAGRRVCPGMHMGVAVVELALANLLYKFDWEMPKGMNTEDLDFDVLPGLTTHRKNALVLVARKRSDD
ncbi:putative Cytochrome P450 [Hibiscus syriacus]|uniref:Cytochrome P450 n=1 Tax=Hibiscus syriacus TaxID=106335 RepID=A0A6A2XPR8_HIBSY|nr:putative Cytochrome P450 [Hibiscus syriacus]